MLNQFSILSNEDISQKAIIIYDDDKLNIISIDNNSQEVIVVFSCANAIGEATAMLGYYRRKNRNIIHISDKQSSWFNNFSAEFVLSQIQDLIKDKKVILCGSSMGGFNAIYFSNFIDSDLCLAYCPQYSIDGDLTGIQEWTVVAIERLSNKDIHTVSFSMGTRYILVFGNDAEEKRSYTKMIPKCIEAGLDFDYIIFDESPHNVPQFLSNQAFDRIHLATEFFIDRDLSEINKAYPNLKTIVF